MKTLDRPLAQPVTQSPLMKRDLLLVLTAGLLMRLAAALPFSAPGYIDGAYYYNVAKNVALGQGLVENFILFYLPVPAHVLHPSNLYWMPLTSLLIVPFFLLGGISFHVAQIPFILLSGTLPLLSYYLGWDIFGKRRYALGMALLTIFAGFYYAIYFTMPDNFAPFAWVGTLTLIFLYKGWRDRPIFFPLAGLTTGLAHLSRADGLLFLLVALSVFALSYLNTRRERRGARGFFSALHKHPPYPGIPAWSLVMFLILYVATMTPWFARNLSIMGSLLPAAGTKTIWLQNYFDVFSYNKDLSFQSYLAWGLNNILRSKWNALLQGLFVLIAIWEFVLAPFFFWGLLLLWRRIEYIPFLLYLLGLYFAMALVFTFPAQRGSLLHSAVALLPFGYGAIVYGLDSIVAWVSKRLQAQSAERRQYAYLTIAIVLSGLLSAFLIITNALTWNGTAVPYRRAAESIRKDGVLAGAPGALNSGGKFLSDEPVVMTADPADYYYETGQPAIAIPSQGIAVILSLADRYQARYLLLEDTHAPAQEALWQGTQETPRLHLLQEIRSQGKRYKLYRILPG